MKKFLLLFLISVLFTSCTTSIFDPSYEDSSYKEQMPYGLHVIVIDSCEYIQGSYSLTHKGNCKYCEERRKKGESND